MAKKYVPQDEEQLNIWLGNFSEVLQEVGRELGISETEVVFLNMLIKKVRNDILKHQMGISNDLLIRAMNKNTLMKSIKGVVNKIKSHPEYSQIKHGDKLGVF